jgi:hypothetical protein
MGSGSCIVVADDELRMSRSWRQSQSLSVYFPSALTPSISRLRVGSGAA